MQQARLFMRGIFGILDAAKLPGCRAQGLVGQVPRGLGPGPAAEDGNLMGL